MRFTCKALIYLAFAATSVLVAACNSSQTSVPSMASTHGARGGSVLMRPAIDGVVTGKKYIYHGCVVYSAKTGTPGDPFANADITNATVDSDSYNVLSNHAIGFDTSDDANLEIVNIASSTTTTYTVHTVPGGHHPDPLTTPAPSGYGGTGPVPWRPSPSPSPFLFEGHYPSSCPNDCHWVTLNTSNCYVFEGDANGGGFSGGVFSTYNGFIDDLSASYASQWANKGDNWSVAGIPGLGFTDYGEDLALTSINHPLQVILPTSFLLPGYNGVNLSPGAGDASGTCSSHCFELGDILRLKSGTCPTDPKAALVCKQLQTYGGMVADAGSDQQLRFGLDSAGNDDTNTALWTWIGTLSSSSFDVITRGALVP